MRFTPARLMFIFIGIGVAIVASFLILNFSPKPDLHLEVIRGTTPETAGGIEYIRFKLTNYSGQDLTNVIVDMGPEDIHTINRIKNGETIIITPQRTDISTITITSAEGIGLTKHL